MIDWLYQQSLYITILSFLQDWFHLGLIISMCQHVAIIFVIAFLFSQSNTFELLVKNTMRKRDWLELYLAFFFISIMGSLIADIVVFILILLYLLILKKQQAMQITYLRKHTFPAAIRGKVKDKYPHLNDDQIDRVFSALKDYFYICNKANKRMVAMPSQVVEVVINFRNVRFVL